MKAFFATVPFLAATVSAHTTFQSLWVNGVAQGKMETSNIRHSWTDPQSNYPLTDVTQANIACNKWASTPAARKVTVPAGSKVTAEWHHEPVQRAGDADEPIALSHKGPIMAYLGKVDNSATASVNGVKWFKIFEDTKDSSGVWAVERFYNNKGLIDFNIPSCVANGDYFLRVEIIGLHEADRNNGAQLYPECAQITITGGGSAAPATVDFPGAYTQNGVGLLYNLYSGNAAYTAPGPRPFTCGAGDSAASSAAAPSSSAAAPATSAATTRSAAATATTVVAATSSVPTTTRASTTAAAPTTLSTSTRRGRTTRTSSTRSSSASVAPVSPAASTSGAATAAPTASATPVTRGGPSAAEVETFFAGVQALYNSWKAGAGA